MLAVSIISLCFLLNQVHCSPAPVKKKPDFCFQCEDGLKCIPKLKVCDGISDCRDSSDENTNCRKLNPDCPPNAFKCSYGACIKGNARCDGLFDCADGSDEKNCYEIEEETKNVTECQPTVKEICDGFQHCEDGSDETAQLCSRLPPCPHLSYRCAYGACVHSQARCNGLTDCADGSDELNCVNQDMCAAPTQLPRNSRIQIKPHNNRFWLTYLCKPQFTLIKESVHMCLFGRWHPAPLRKNAVICENQKSTWLGWFKSFII